MTTETRTDRRIHQEHTLAEVVRRLTDDNTTAQRPPTPALVNALNDTLVTLNQAHRKSRDVKRTSQPTGRELHRRTVDGHLRLIAVLTDALTDMLETYEPSTDRDDALAIVRAISRAATQVGYR